MLRIIGFGLIILTAFFGFLNLYFMITGSYPMNMINGLVFFVCMNTSTSLYFTMKKSDLL